MTPAARPQESPWNSVWLLLQSLPPASARPSATASSTRQFCGKKKTANAHWPQKEREHYSIRSGCAPGARLLQDTKEGDCCDSEITHIFEITSSVRTTSHKHLKLMRRTRVISAQERENLQKPQTTSSAAPTTCSRGPFVYIRTTEHTCAHHRNELHHVLSLQEELKYRGAIHNSQYTSS